MKTKLLLLSVLTAALVYTGNSYSQVSSPGTPKSFTSELSQDINFVTMPPLNIQVLLEEDRVEAQYKDIPPRFGFPFSVNHGLTNAGTWTTLRDGSKIWRLGVYSPGAISINLIFDRFYMPKGASFFVYNFDRTMVLGAFNENNNIPERMFSTAPVKGDYIILELNLPAYAFGAAELNVSTVTHAYKNIFGFLERDDFGQSGACNRNVICPEGDPWRNQIRSVAMILSSGGSRLCTGSLVNNTRNDGTPFFMSAYHCGTNGTTWIFMFRYQSALCTPSQDGPTTYTVSGATLLASNTASDFTLFRLSSRPPISYNVYYAGWDRRDIAPTSGSGIHHPSGDVKKISFSNTPFISDTWGGTPPNSHWRVNWSPIGGGEVPITEPGSSGSPVYDQNKRFVGQLHGGPSYCYAPPSSLNDLYGKFSMSWDYGGTPSTRARDWLDSINTGALFIDGYDPSAGPLNAFNLLTPASGITITTYGGSSTPYTFTWDTASAGATYKWIYGTPLPGNRRFTVSSFTNNLTMTLGQLDAYLAAAGVNPGDSLVGQWDIWAFRNNPPANDSLKSTNGPRALTLKRGLAVLTAFNLVSPVNNSTIATSAGSNAPINITWTRSGQGATYRWFFASPNFSPPQSNIKFRVPSNNSGFDSVLTVTSGALDAMLAGIGLNPGDSIAGQWRVYAYRLPTDSLSSSQTYNLTLKRSLITSLCRSVNKPILDNQWTRDTVSVNLGSLANIVDVNVRIDTVTHTWDGDLAFYITSPLGQSVRIIGRVGGSGDNFINTVLDDQASVPIASGTAPFTGSFIPTNPLSVYNAQNPNGNWVLSIADSAGGDTGALRAWCLVITYSTLTGGIETMIIPNRFYLSQNYPNPFNPLTKIKYGIPRSSFVTLKVYDILGKEVVTLVNENKNAGSYTAVFDGTNLASGVYFYRMEAGSFVQNMKMVLVK